MAHIMLPTDFSDGSLNACAYAFDLYGVAGNTFILAHTYMDPLPGYAVMVDMTSAQYADAVEGLAHFTGRLRKLKGGADAVVVTEALYGPLTSALNTLCEEKDVDLIVMGTQGATGGDLFGSSAGSVAKTSIVPVLVVPRDAHFTGLRNILLADDHGRVEPLPLQPLVQLARRSAAHITIAHVLSTDEQVPDPQVVADYAGTFAGIAHSFTSDMGEDVALALSSAAERNNMDLVAVLHRHTGFMESLFHGSVAKRLAMHSRIPLLVLQR